MAVNTSRKARIARRRKRRVDSVVNDLTDAQWAALKTTWAGCAYCGKQDGSLQRDCVLAISRGGRYTLENVVPACRSCNTSKCNDEVTAWLRRKRLDERAFLQRYVELRMELRLLFPVGSVVTERTATERTTAERTATERTATDRCVTDQELEQDDACGAAR